VGVGGDASGGVGVVLDEHGGREPHGRRISR
jgi:hypothetical protein